MPSVGEREGGIKLVDVTEGCCTSVQVPAGT